MYQYHIAGCPISSYLLRRFARLFVYPAAPLFVSEEMRSLFPSDIQYVERQGFAVSSLSLTYRDTYLLYSIPANADYCVFLPYTAFNELPRDVQQQLIVLQYSYNHSHIYDWRDIQPFVEGHASPQLLDTRRYQTGDSEIFFLDYAVWSLLPGYQQRRWLCWYLAQEQVWCYAQELSSNFWSALPSHQRPVISHLVGSFVATSGPNCFATTLAAIAPSEEVAAHVQHRWIGREEFFDVIVAFGYSHIVIEPSQLLVETDKVLVWRDSSGVIQHSAYLIQNEMVVNKNAQTWFAPRQLVRLAELIAYWGEDGFTMEVYGR